MPSPVCRDINMLDLQGGCFFDNLFADNIQ